MTTKTNNPGPTLDAPQGERAICRGANCGATIYWRLTASGCRCPFNADGSVHWATCPDAPSFKRRK